MATLSQNLDLSILFYLRFTVYALIEAQSLIDAQAPPAANIPHQIHIKCLIKTQSKDHQEAVKFEQYSGRFGYCTYANCHFHVNKGPRGF